MYADRVEAETRRSIKDRLNGNFRDDSSRRRQITGKRQRQDDKWEHDLYQDGEPQVSNHKVDARDLRLKLQRKSQQASESGRGSQSGVRDLREKLSGTMHPQPMNYDPPKPTPEASKPARKSVAVQASTLESKKVSNAAAKKKAPQKASSTVDDFLQSLGLEKYSITFQAEEVDMTALAHMTDEDLKAIGIPMGPRKKILLALESRT
ncbi:ankyrin repeat and SAM domain-containing protein 6 [Morus notabilis]|uniref:ankyrin repeat and SAM domain-containing protein 6 n=1 Tax=Morus notabilis TaxID=981085 RepID=UPI000CED63CB|nr:ankyrin repeat and SAM domain-containing protein 6 [Morus notabilis]